MTQVRSAIIFPAISMNHARLFLYSCLALVAILALVLPREVNNAGNGILVWLFELATAVPAIRAEIMSESMQHPVAFAVGALVAMLLGVIFAIVFCFTAGNVSPLVRLVSGRSVLSRTIYVCGALLLVWMYTIAEPSLEHPLRIGAALRDALGAHRFVLLIFLESYFFVPVIAIVWCIFELSNVLYWRNHG